MKRLTIAAVIIIAGTLSMPVANADTCNYYQPCHGPVWPGQLQDTWNLPGIYGGLTSDPVFCNPITTRCAVSVPNPNGGN